MTRMNSGGRLGEGLRQEQKLRKKGVVLVSSVDA